VVLLSRCLLPTTTEEGWLELAEDPKNRTIRKREIVLRRATADALEPNGSVERIDAPLTYFAANKVNEMWQIHAVLIHSMNPGQTVRSETIQMVHHNQLS
jgi:hypothetical protein